MAASGGLSSGRVAPRHCGGRCRTNDSELFPSPVADLFREGDTKVIAAGRAMEFVARAPDPRGPRISIVTKFPVTIEGQPSGAVGGIATDMSELKRSETLLEAEKGVLQLIARGGSLLTVLEAVCRMVEEQTPGILSSVLQLDQDTQRLRHGAAPSLPDAYNQAIDGVEIGPSVGSCGTAAFRGRPVVVRDIASDPLWAGFSEMALAHGLRACWSTPIFSTTGSVLGTIALYASDTHEPTPDEMLLIDRAARRSPASRSSASARKRPWSAAPPTIASWSRPPRMGSLRSTAASACSRPTRGGVTCSDTLRSRCSD